MIEVDGAHGEGGGQILRTALSLSLCLGQPFRITDIRQTRPKPGLQPQHLAAVRAAARVGRAEVVGAELGSAELTFRPQRLEAGHYEIDIATAGSTTLILQTLLPALALADASSVVVIRGGTHNPFAPPYEFLERAYLPLLNRMGPQVQLHLVAHGFYPHGGGLVQAQVQPARRWSPLQLLERGHLGRARIDVLLSRLPRHIAEREVATLTAALDLNTPAVHINIVTDSPSPANVLTVTLEYEQVTEVFTALGRRGLPAEEVATELAAEVRRYLRASAPVGIHLADQLLLPLALAGGGAFRTLDPSPHTLTNRYVIQRFLPLSISIQPLGADDTLVTLG